MENVTDVIKNAYAGRFDTTTNTNGRSQWGTRPDGKAKGYGWLGLLHRPDGTVSSELSAGVEIGGREVEIPLLVPGLDQNEIAWLLTNEPGPDYYQSMPPSIMQKAYAHAASRLSQGLSPFKD